MTTRAERRKTLLADPRNRAILTALDDAGRPLHVNALADRLVREGEGVVDATEHEQRLERTRISLHHDRLPRLAEAGAIDYDPETNVAARRDDPVDVDWLDGETADEVLARFDDGGSSGDATIGVIEGRRSVIECGRRLADEAEDELFCMYHSTDLLEDECVRRAEEAVSRGVEMYMGSRDGDVRDLTRTHLPDATIWEPQRDWTKSPSAYPRVGRLVLVDRQKVMLGLLDEPGLDDDPPAETAMVGEGEQNPLVVLVRDLLGPRLDHLDRQSTDFRSELPS